MSRFNFFTEMVSVSKTYEVGGLSPLATTAFDKLSGYVENAPFTKSKHTKFICKNWRLSSKELISLWERVSGTIKSPNTFRSQVSTASSMLHSIFPSFSMGIFIDEDNQVLLELISLVDALYEEETYPEDIFISEVTNYFESSLSEKTFSISECQEEIKALKVLRKSNIFHYLDTIDPEKFKFILSVLSSPLSSNRSRSINNDKFELLKLLSVLDVPTIAEASENLTPEEKKQTKVIIQQVPEKTHYNFGITKEMEAIIDKHINRKVADSDLEDRNERNFNLLKQYISLLSPQGLDEFLSQRKLFDLIEVFAEYDKEKN